MKKLRTLLFTISISTLVVLSGLLVTSCDEAKDAVNDVRSTAALKNVEFTYNEMNFEVSLPENALSGEPFDSLYKKNKEIYGNPANYTINIKTMFTADNTSQDAKDAKFDGMFQNLVFNKIEESPLEYETKGFVIEQDAIINVISEGSINLETHRLPGKYIFQQMVSGNDVNTNIVTNLLYEIGGKEGSIKALDLQKDIPTRASDEMKDFLEGLLDSGLLDEEQQ